MMKLRHHSPSKVHNLQDKVQRIGALQYFHHSAFHHQHPVLYVRTLFCLRKDLKNLVLLVDASMVQMVAPVEVLVSLYLAVFARGFLPALLPHYSQIPAPRGGWTVKHSSFALRRA
ncbi:hypothetical protein Hypma_003224 [Hypsizygus marmoreus]|uniref:Uncharacterized protein n=1 Tax=Hypsizygus marmoreus TaxID=39966 RepID=A0A369JZI4_HYPMA|nr:hypothetical protein Hypma_003224 [Hypsizygus marmoreus]